MKVKSSILTEIEIVLNSGKRLQSSGNSCTFQSDGFGSLFFKVSEISEIIEALRRLQDECVDFEIKRAKLSQL